MLHEIARYHKIVTMFDRTNPRCAEMIEDIIETRAPPLFDKIDFQKMIDLVEEGDADSIIQFFKIDPRAADGTTANPIFGVASMNMRKSVIPEFGLIVIPKTNLKFFGKTNTLLLGGDGIGILTVDNTYYRGFMRDGKYEGMGFYKKNDWKYNGEFKDGKRHGPGELIYNCGVRYLGDFVDDLMDGEGHYYLLDENGGHVPEDVRDYEYQFSGQFQKGLFHGYGIYETPAHKIAGEFFNGVMKFVTLENKKSGIITPMIIPHKIMGKDYRREVEEGGETCPWMVLSAQLKEFFAVYAHITEVGDRLSANLKSHRGGYKMW